MLIGACDIRFIPHTLKSYKIKFLRGNGMGSKPLVPLDVLEKVVAYSVLVVVVYCAQIQGDFWSERICFASPERVGLTKETLRKAGECLLDFN